MLQKARREMKDDKRMKSMVSRATEERNARIESELKSYRAEMLSYFWEGLQYSKRWHLEVRHGYSLYESLSRMFSYRDEMKRKIDDPNVLREEILLRLGKFEIEREMQEYMLSFQRTQRRFNRFRNELEEGVRRWNTNHMCRAIKEELMAEVWHPRRVEKLLEQGYESYLFDA